MTITVENREIPVLLLTGYLGSGKTTLVNLIPRFYDVTEGKAEIDGLEISKYRTETLRKQIGVVPQKAVLFKGSIGRTDFPRGDHQQLLDSIQRECFSLPDETQFISGHGPVSTIGFEKQHNPFVAGKAG